MVNVDSYVWSVKRGKSRGRNNLNHAFDWKKVVTNTWDNNAEDWDQRSEKMWEQGSRKTILPFVQSHFEIKQHVLDVGCGSGYGSLKLQQAGYDVTGVDISEEMIRLAKQKRSNENIRFQQADINDLPFADATFDAMLSINVIEWTKVPEVALNEMTRVLKSGGLLCVGVLGATAGPRQHSYPRVYGKDVMQNTMMPWEFVRLAKEKGYELVAEQGVWKKEMDNVDPETLPTIMQQAVSFMWLFMLQKK